MQNISLFKLSRYFFIWFLLITVLPLLSLLLWSNYGMEQNMRTRHKQFLESFAAEMPLLFSRYLDSEMEDIRRISQNLPGETTSLDEYKSLLKAKQVYWLDSPEAKAFMRQHAASLGKTERDYFISDHAMQSFFRIPVRNVHQGLLIIQSVPLDYNMPKGPISAEVYAGSKVKKSALLFKSGPSRMRPFPGLGPQAFKGYRHPPDVGFEKWNGPSPPPFGPPGHEPDWDCASPRQIFNPACKPVAEKLVPVLNRAGTQIATVRLLAMPPPRPPHLIEDLTQWLGALILLAGLLMSLLAGNYIRQNFIEPLANLSMVARKVGSGNLSCRIYTEAVRQPEVRQALEHVNAMLDGLIEKEQLRSSFISNLTHDFRTPLIAEGRSLEILVQEFQQLGLTKQEKLATGILKNNDHLLTMVNQLLETYQTEAGMFKLTLGMESLPALIEQCFEQLESLASEREILMVQSLDETFPSVQVDAYYLKRVLINLIGNALNNIPKGSLIEVFGHRLGQDQVEIHVKDNGPGISSVEQAHVFDRYYAGTGDTRKLGSGLGLYICQVLIAAHQGSIRVDSVEGEYTDFIIQLPIQGDDNPS